MSRASADRSFVDRPAPASPPSALRPCLRLRHEQRAARPAARAAGARPGRAPRSAPAAPAPLALRPCTDRSRAPRHGVGNGSCRRSCQLALSAADRARPRRRRRGARGARGRARAESSARSPPRSAATSAPHGRVRARRARRLAARQRRRARRAAPRARRRRSSSRTAQRSGQVVAEQRRERGPQLLGPERLVLEERQLPAVERLRELGVAVGVTERARAARPRSAPRNASSRVGSPGGCVAAIGKTGRMPNGLPSSVSNSTGPGRERRRSRQAGSRSPRPRSRRARRADPLRDRARRRARARSTDRARCPNPGGRSPRASGQCVDSSPAAAARTAQSGRELELRADRQPDQRRDRAVTPPLAEERALELRVRALERLVVPVEAAARLGGRDAAARAAPCGTARRPRSRRGPAWAARRSPRPARAASSSRASRASSRAAQPRLPLLDERAHERP